MTAEPSTGNLNVQVRNVGQATWQQHDLKVRVTRPSGEEQGVYTFPNVTIQPGAFVVLTDPDLHPSPPLGVCVELDPDNAVQEVIDRLVDEGILAGHGRYCPPLPDLRIGAVEYNQEHERLGVTVENYGEVSPLSGRPDGSLINANVTIFVNLPDGRPIAHTFPNVDIGVRGSTVLSMALEAGQRERMRGGYTVAVDPNNTIAETNEDNNEFSVPGSTRLRLVWSSGWSSFCVSGNYLAGGKNTWDMRMHAVVTGAGGNRGIVSWNGPEFETSYATHSEPWCKSPPFVSEWFDVAGDEELDVSRTAGLSIVGHGYRWLNGGVDALNAANNFGGTTTIPEDYDPACFAGQTGSSYDWGGGGGVGCGAFASGCSILSTEGLHDSGTIYASGEGITGVCYWATTYGLYKAGE